MGEGMKALTIWQPWASLVVFGVKKFETRSWATEYRGPLAIHAAKLTFDRVFNMFGDVRSAVAFEQLCFELLDTDNLRDLPKGCIIGTVELIDCERIGISAHRLYTQMERHLGDFTPGRYAWRVGNAQRLPQPVPCRGAQGLWNVPDGLLEAASRGDQGPTVQLDMAVTP